MDRRRFLQAVGATSAATTTAIAGCNRAGAGDASLGGDESEDGQGDGDGDGSDSTRGDRAGYDSWVASDAVEADTAGAFSLDLSILREFQADEETAVQETTAADDSPTDPLVGIPGTYVVAAAFGLGFGLAGTGLAPLVEEDGDADRASFVAGSTILEGSLDADTIGDDVTQAGFEGAEEYEGYAIYERGTGEDATVVAVSADAVVRASADEDRSDPMALVKSLVAANAGTESRYSEESAEFDELVTALPERDVMAATYDADGNVLEADGETETTTESSSGLTSFSDLDLDGDATGGAVSASFTDTTLESSIVIQYASESEVDDESDVEDALGFEATERSVRIDGRLVFVDGRFEEGS